MRIPYLSICVFLWFGENALVQAEEAVPDQRRSQSKGSGKQIFGSSFNFQLGEVEENPGWNPPKQLEGWGWQPGKGQSFGWQPVSGWGWTESTPPQKGKGWTQVKEQKGWGWTPEPHHQHVAQHHPKGKGKGRRPHRRPKKGRRRGKKKGHRKGKKGLPRLKYFPPGIKFIPPKIRIERPKILIRRPKIRFVKG